MKAIILVFIGGGIGSVLRYATSLALKNTAYSNLFPWSTFIVNILGSFLIGFLTCLALKNALNPDLRLLLIVGLCGGFTTFSTFANESLILLKDHSYITFLAYTILSISLGILAVALGNQLGEHFNS